MERRVALEMDESRNAGAMEPALGMQKLRLSPGWIVAAAFVAYLAIGIFVFRDYGISWDEPFQREYGQEVFDYVFKGDLRLFQNSVRFHGPVFAFLLAVAENLLPLTDTRDIYFMRHLVTFLIFYGGVASFYLLCRHIFSSWKLGLLGSSLLVMHPRLFADSFYNSKDIPFLAFFITSVLTLVWFADRRTAGYGVLHALSCGVLIAIRFAGIIVPAMTLVVLGLDSVVRGRRREIGKGMVVFGLYVTALLLVVVILWPTLWRDPVGGLRMALGEAVEYPYTETVRYLDRDIPATDLTWNYLLVWIGISTPLVPLSLALVGIGKVIGEMMGGGYRAIILNRGVLVAIMWIGIPFLSVVLTHPVLYDGWRHFFFVYPGIVVMVLIGLVFLWGTAGRIAGVTALLAARAGIGLVVVLALISGVRSITEYHPFQNAYFNELVGGAAGANKKFELGYWGLSYRRGLEYILETDKALEVPIYVAQEVGTFNAVILEPKERERLRFVEESGRAQYLLTNFRWQKENDSLAGQPYYSVNVGGAEILAVRKLAPPPILAR